MSTTRSKLLQKKLQNKRSEDLSPENLLSRSFMPKPSEAGKFTPVLTRKSINSRLSSRGLNPSVKRESSIRDVSPCNFSSNNPLSITSNSQYFSSKKPKPVLSNS